MKIKTLAIMLATTLALTNQECVSASFTIDMEELLSKGDINMLILPNQQPQITHAGEHLWSFNQQGGYEKTSKVKVNSLDLLSISWEGTEGEQAEQIYMLKKLELSQVASPAITLKLRIPGTIKDCGSNVPVHIGEKAFKGLVSYVPQNLSLELEFVYGNGFVNAYRNGFVKFPYNCSQLCEGSNVITGMDFSGADTSETIYMSSMFKDCTRLKELRLDNFNMQNVFNSLNMFDNCQQLDTLKFGHKTLHPQQNNQFSTTEIINNIVDTNKIFWNY